MNRSDTRKRTTTVVTGGRPVTDASYGSKSHRKAPVVGREKPFRCRCCPDAKSNASTRARPTVDAAPRRPQQPLWVASAAAASALRTETTISRGNGDGLTGDNVFHQRRPSPGGPSGMLATTAHSKLRLPSPRVVAVSADIDLPQDDSGSRPDECSLEQLETEDSRLLRLLCHFEPLRTAQFLSQELAAKQRELGPEHRQLCQIGKQLSEVVQLLAKQQQQPPSVSIEANKPTDTEQTPPAASGKLEPGSEAKKDEIECCNCALIQRKWDEDRARHTQETVRLNEQINYLQQQLTLAGNVEMGLKQTMTEHQQRLEQKLLELSATVDVKQCLEGPLIRAQHRKLKDTRNRLKVAERDSATLRQRIADLVVDNEKKELLLQAQDTNIERVKSELHAIRRLSIRQIEYLDDDTVDDTAASHRQVTEHSYALDSPTYSAFSPETQLKSEARSSTGRLVSATNVDDDDDDDDVLRPETSQPVTSQPATAKIRLDGASSSTSANSLVPDESRMPSTGVTVASDRDDVRSTSASSCFVASNTWMTASMLTLYTASTWTPVQPPEAMVTMARDDADDDDDDDHHHRHLIAELIESVTLPSSPVPFDFEDGKEVETKDVKAINTTVSTMPGCVEIRESASRVQQDASSLAYFRSLDRG